MKKAVFPTMLTVSLFTLAAMAQGLSSSQGEANVLQIRTSAEIETACRIKAKEIAAETYRGCVTDQKNAQIEQIKKEYQDKMAALKSHYEAELKKMAGSKSSESQNENAVAPVDTGADVKTEQEIQSSDAIAAEVIQTQEINAEVVADPNTGKMESTKVEKTEKTTKAQKTLPVKKQTSKLPVKKSVNVKKTVTIQKKNPFQAPAQVTEMSVQLKPAPKGALMDANGDLPEPIPVEVEKQGSI